jgi:DNA ligase-1
MKEKSFKPMLAPNEKVDLSTLNYPLLASTKLDGIRCIFYKGQILSRSLKQIQCQQLRERLEPLRQFSELNQVIFDGEIYSPKLTFQQITHFTMTRDLGDEELPEHLRFYCFDMLDGFDRPFEIRNDVMEGTIGMYNHIAYPVKQKEVNSEKEITTYFEEVLSQDYEGLILRDPKSFYKFGRGTIKEGIIFKVKPFLDFDGQIIDVIQATEVNEDAEKKINELGRSVTSKKKGERHTIDKASAFMVKYEGKDLKVVLSMTDEEKEEVWKNRDSYLGKWISYKGMLVGSKDVPRHPVMLRFREPK